MPLFSTAGSYFISLLYNKCWMLTLSLNWVWYFLKTLLSKRNRSILVLNMVGEKDRSSYKRKRKGRKFSGRQKIYKQTAWLSWSWYCHKSYNKHMSNSKHRKCWCFFLKCRWYVKKKDATWQPGSELWSRIWTTWERIQADQFGKFVHSCFEDTPHLCGRYEFFVMNIEQEGWKLSLILKCDLSFTLQVF